MRHSSLLAAALAAFVLSLPVCAQTDTVAGNPGAAVAASGSRHGTLGTLGPADCSRRADPQGCAARKAAHRRIAEACRDQPAAQRQQCMHRQAQMTDCSQARQPEQCEERKTAYALCEGQTGPRFRNCVLQKTLPADCSRAADVALCQRQDRARKRCGALSGDEHRQCVLEILSPGQ